MIKNITIISSFGIIQIIISTYLYIIHPQADTLPNSACVILLNNSSLFLVMRIRDDKKGLLDESGLFS